MSVVVHRVCRVSEVQSSAMSNLGDFVRERRIGLGWSQAVIARRAQIPRSYLSNIEHGRSGLPSVDYRRRLASALGLTQLDLLLAAGEVTREEIRFAAVKDADAAVKEPDAAGDGAIRRAAELEQLLSIVFRLDGDALEVVARLASVNPETLRLLGELANWKAEWVL